MLKIKRLFTVSTPRNVDAAYNFISNQAETYTKLKLQIFYMKTFFHVVFID